MSNDTIKSIAKAYAQRVSTSRRVNADLYIGSRLFNTVTSIVEAAYIDGYAAAVERMLSHVMLQRRPNDVQDEGVSRECNLHDESEGSQG